MAQPILVDLRNVYPPEDVESAGLRWFGVGRPSAAAR
jgi:UDPglucose 6-dehydrogenase